MTTVMAMMMPLCRLYTFSTHYVLGSAVHAVIVVADIAVVDDSAVAVAVGNSTEMREYW